MSRTTHQFQLSDDELDDLYRLAELPKQVSKSVALRTVLTGYKDQIAENGNLKQLLVQLSK